MTIQISEISKLLDSGESHIKAQGLKGSSKAYLLASLLKANSRPILALAPTHLEAQTLADEISFFLGDDAKAPALPWDAKVVLFPSRGVSPLDVIADYPEISARQISALFRAHHGGPFICVAPVTAALQLTPPLEVIDESSVLLSVGEEIDRDDMARRLIKSGYHFVSQVEERGEACRRGGIMDIFAPFYDNPLRIEFFGDEIESIRLFDPNTQRSTTRLSEAVALPAKEVIAGEKEIKDAVEKLRGRCRELRMDRAATMEALESIRSPNTSHLAATFFTYFHAQAPPLWKHFPDSTLLVLDESTALEDRIKELSEEVRISHEKAVALGRAAPRPEEVCVSINEWKRFSESTQRIDFDSFGFDSVESDSIIKVKKSPRTMDFRTSSNQAIADAMRQKRAGDRLLEPLIKELDDARDKGLSTWIVARSPGSAQKISDFLSAYNIETSLEQSITDAARNDGKIHLFSGSVDRGFCFPGAGLMVVTETEILGPKIRRPSPRSAKGFGASIADLKPGDSIVHSDFGIGLFHGLTRLNAGGEEGDYLLLEYADNARLYLPVTRIGLVQKYAAPGDGAPKLAKLGTNAWAKAKQKAREGIEKLAHELLEIYAKREIAQRPAYSKPDLAYQEFEATFPYEETPDQATAIDHVLKDMSGSRPMDRLICGDVGFGKTEVAIRAAFRAVNEGRQVAVMVPTTVLAAQHHQNFTKRFENHPIVVGMLSRFVAASEQKVVIKQLAEGKADVVVGTHRLLQSDVKFKNLGLIVVDEEHRFGIAHKEKLKKFRANVDVLTLSATPIPRTLHMGLSGARDISIIQTPPTDRQAVRTFVGRFDEDLIREALQRELNRGGQIFFVHNRVQSIEEMARRIGDLVPAAKVGIGHGQMNEGALEKVMKDFVSAEIDILVCTAIVESGLDIPRANTIIINNADRHGLADLHQLRGRVGRSNMRAYAYLLVAEETKITTKARKRLQALQDFADLGSGFKIASHDLEIRGAGDFLGKNQSGHIAAIGFDLYAELLQGAVGKLKGEPFEKPPEPDIKLKIPAFFPVDYVEDAAQRLELYERFIKASDDSEIDEMRYELIDRFGNIPIQVEHLIEVMKIRKMLVDVRALGLHYTGSQFSLMLSEDSLVSPEKVLEFVSSGDSGRRLTPDHRLLWSPGGPLEPDQIFDAARDLLNRLN